MDSVQTLPIPLADSPMIPMRGMSPALQIMLDDKMFDRAKMIAGYLAKADGFVPRHLVGKPEACFAVVMRSITWKLDPFAVAMSTYQTPGGSIGFEGKLCQAILENSGHLEGPVKFEHKGDWSKVQGKFEIKTSANGKGKYPAPAWKPEDEKGLAVIVTAQVRGEVEPRRFEFELVQAFPRNSTLWATDPKTQLQYTAVRRFASSAAPGIFMGVPFDRDDSPIGDSAVDINPRPRRGDFSEGGPTSTSATTDVFMFQVVDFDDEARTFSDPTEAAGHLLMLMQDAHKARGGDGVEGIWESNGLLITELRERDNDELADKLAEEYGRLLDAPKNSPASGGNTADAPSSERAPEPGKTDAAAPAGSASAGEQPAGDLLNAAEQQRDWPKFGNTMVEKINACQSEADVDKVMKKNAAHLPGYAAWNQNKHDDLMTFVGLRREEIQAAASQGR